ncbi:MAG: hypothetical protein V1874_15490 [Spirochaetota bacterium]
MNTIIRLFIASLFSAVVFTACGPGDSGSGGSGPCASSALPVIEITNNITSPAAWIKGNVYLIKKYDFYVMDTLTIEPGAIVKFHPDDGPYMILDSSNGRIVANGTSVDPIIFTSYKDDAHGGDTNDDCSASSPAKGDWISINTNGADASIFNYCEFYYGGGSGDNRALCIYYQTATVTNCIFAHNNSGKFDDFYFGALDANLAETGTIITGNTFYDNILPLSISSKINIDDSNIFHSGATGNTYNGIFLHAGDDFANNITWAETEVAFVMYDNSLWVNSGCTLTLGNNVTIKFTANVLNLEDGDSAIANHNGAGVAFTSFKDDSRKGDTNGDGYSAGANGDWLGIYNDAASVYVGWPTIWFN